MGASEPTTPEALLDFATADANEELDKITPRRRDHPSVLEVRWQVCANLEKWDAALEIAGTIVRMVPDWPSGWIYRASSLTELNRHREAYETLSTAAVRFPTDETIFYDLACVCCALTWRDEAWAWLCKAIEEGENEIRLKALEDPDLEPLWARLRDA